MISNQEWTIELLQEAKLLSVDDRNAAEASRKNSESVIEALIRTGIISEEQIARTLAVNAAMEYVDLHDFKPPVGLKSLVSHEVALKYNIAPLGKTQKALSIVVEDPYDFDMLDSLPGIIQPKLEFYCSTPAMIKELQVRIYGNKAGTIGKRSSEQVDSKTLDNKAVIGGIWTNRPDTFTSRWQLANANLLESVNASLAKLRQWQEKQSEHERNLQDLTRQLEGGRLNEAEISSKNLGKVKFAGLNYQPVAELQALELGLKKLEGAKRGKAAQVVKELRVKYPKAEAQSELIRELNKHQARSVSEKRNALLIALLLLGLTSAGGKVMFDGYREQQQLAAEAKAQAEVEQKEKDRLAAEAKAKADADLLAITAKLQSTSPVAQLEIPLSSTLLAQFCFIPFGSFTMGSSSSEEQRSSDEGQVEVTLSQSFWLARTEVTQAQWEALMGSNPSQFKGSNLPVENVSWDDAQSFIAKLNDKQILPQGWKFALPTEAQWEYACRAEEKGPYSGGSLDEVGWYDDNSESKTHEVGQKKPNAWGLHDMHGNVYEWCADWYNDTLQGGVDPTGLSSGDSRVSRGGSWYYYASFCRAAHRVRHSPGYRINDLGFRPALVPSK
jgi:formylglycine-generating enzyme required for sulfatase activity